MKIQPPLMRPRPMNAREGARMRYQEAGQRLASVATRHGYSVKNFAELTKLARELVADDNTHPQLQYEAQAYVSALRAFVKEGGKP